VTGASRAFRWSPWAAVLPPAHRREWAPVCSSPVDSPDAHPPGRGLLTGNGRPYSDGQVPPVLLSICEWWVGLSAEERSGLLEVAEWAEIDRKVDAAVLGEPT
jgi:hypothetical protein